MKTPSDIRLEAPKHTVVAVGHDDEGIVQVQVTPGPFAPVEESEVQELGAAFIVLLELVLENRDPADIFMVVVQACSAARARREDTT